VGRVIQAEGKKVSFADGKAVEVDTVVWATGYRDDIDWVAIPEVKDARGNFLHYRGISSLPNLCFIGRSWQWSRGSALFAGVGEDAAYLTEHLVGLFDHRVAA
jgi:putative flavoprotein involved in K+ transport